MYIHYCQFLTVAEAVNHRICRDFPNFGRFHDITSPGRYHWSFIVGPKTEIAEQEACDTMPKTRQHGNSQWLFEERDCALAPSSMLLVRVMVAENKDRLISVLRNTPIKQG
jgi:hypothetical protein